MDYINVFNAARDNNLHSLKLTLNGKSASEISMLVSAKTNGATPLVISCRNGHYEIVEYLLTKCHANVEQVGSVSFDGEPIEDAPPLWCSAAAGHLGIVKLLVRRGANVNSTTRTNSTPLRAACFDGHFEIVRYLVHHGADFEIANRHGHTCLMIACFKGHYRIAQYLLSLKADVNRCSIKGNTALHDCAESGSLEILQLLLKHGATMDVDYFGMTPLLAASVTGHLPIVEHLITLPSVSRESRIDALELLGATYVDKKRDIVSALALWRRAMEERNQKPEIPKVINAPIAAYEYVSEVTTLAQLDDLILDPDEMRMQALVIRQRILGPTHPDTSYYIRFRGAHYADAGRFDRCIELWTYALTMQQKILQPLSPMTQSSLLSFAELFSFMLLEHGRLLRGRIVPQIGIEDMLMIFEKAVLEVERGQEYTLQQSTTNKTVTAVQGYINHSDIDDNALSRALVSALHIGCLVSGLIDDPEFCPIARKEILRTLYRLNKLNVTVHSGRTALHYACYRESTLVGRYPACQFPSPALAKALLEVGADPNATDEAGNTPLHLIATYQLFSKYQTSFPMEYLREITTSLLDKGAHLDAKNHDGETFESLLEPRIVRTIVNPLQHTTLACLAARTIKTHKIKYNGHVPAHLTTFIEVH